MSSEIEGRGLFIISWAVFRGFACPAVPGPACSSGLTPPRWALVGCGARPSLRYCFPCRPAFGPPPASWLSLDPLFIRCHAIANSPMLQILNPRSSLLLISAHCPLSAISPPCSPDLVVHTFSPLLLHPHWSSWSTFACRAPSTKLRNLPHVATLRYSLPRLSTCTFLRCRRTERCTLPSE